MSPETVEKTVSSVHPGSLIVKGQSNEIFDPQFFIIWTYLTNGLKHVRLWLRIPWVIWILSSKIPGGVSDSGE